VVLGRKNGAVAASFLAVLAYGLVAAFVASGVAPIGCLLVFLAAPALAKGSNFSGKALSPPEYGSKTMAAFVDSTSFTLLLAAGLLLS